MTAARPLSPFPQRPDDAPTVGAGIVNAGRISPIAIAAGAVALVLCAVAEWFWVGAEDSRVLTRLLASLFLAAAPAVFATLLVEWMLQRKLVHQMLRQLKEPFGGPDWAVESRAACPFDAGNNPAGDLQKGRLYSQKIEEWKEPFQARLKVWYFLSAAAVAAPSIGYFLSMTPERARHLSPLGSLLPAALGLLLGAASALVAFFDDACWTQLFLEWKKWASTKDRAPLVPPREEDPIDDFKATPAKEPPAPSPTHSPVTDDWDALSPAPKGPARPIPAPAPPATTVGPTPSTNGTGASHDGRLETPKPQAPASAAATVAAASDAAAHAASATADGAGDRAASHPQHADPAPAPNEFSPSSADAPQYSRISTSDSRYDNH